MFMIDLSKENVQRMVEDGLTQIKTIVSYLILPVVFPLVFLQECVNWLKAKFGLDQRSLEGKVVLITGASAGIGERLAHHFYRGGCRLILASRTKSELDRVKNDLVRSRATGTVYVPAVLKMDVGDLASMQSKARAVLDIYQTVDIVIHNAGMGYRGTFLNTEVEVQEKLMNVNYLGPLALTKYLLHHMVDQKSGHIVFISSVQGKISIPNQSAYATSKHAMNALADCLRAELANQGVQVTTINPGYVHTQFSVHSVTGSGASYGHMDQSLATGMSPDFVAQRTFKAVMNGEKEVVVSPILPKLAIFLRNFAPSIYFFIMARRALTMNH